MTIIIITPLWTTYGQETVILLANNQKRQAFDLSNQQFGTKETEQDIIIY